MSIGSTIQTKLKETVASSVYDNPVVVKEFRTRMRGWKAFIVMGIYVLLLSVCVFIHYINIADTSAFAQGNHMPLGNMRVGARLFSTIVWTQTILLMFILPALTSGALTHELERKTIEMLALTRLSAGKIVLGKHLSGFLYALMLLACSLPLASMCLMFGGLSPAEVAVTYALLATFSFMFTAIGVYWSSIFKNTASAGVCSYGISLGYVFLTAILGAALMFRSAYGPAGMPPRASDLFTGPAEPKQHIFWNGSVKHESLRTGIPCCNPIAGAAVGHRSTASPGGDNPRKIPQCRTSITDKTAVGPDHVRVGLAAPGRNEPNVVSIFTQ